MPFTYDCIGNGLETSHSAMCLLETNLALWLQSGVNYPVALYVVVDMLLRYFLSLSNQCAASYELKH